MLFNVIVFSIVFILSFLCSGFLICVFFIKILRKWDRELDELIRSLIGENMRNIKFDLNKKYDKTDLQLMAQAQTNERKLDEFEQQIVQIRNHVQKCRGVTEDMQYLQDRMDKLEGKESE